MRVFIYAAYLGYLLFIILAFTAIKPLAFPAMAQHYQQIEQELTEIDGGY